MLLLKTCQFQDQGCLSMIKPNSPYQWLELDSACPTALYWLRILNALLQSVYPCWLDGCVQTMSPLYFNDIWVDSQWYQCHLKYISPSGLKYEIWKLFSLQLHIPSCKYSFTPQVGTIISVTHTIFKGRTQGVLSWRCYITLQEQKQGMTVTEVFNSVTWNWKKMKNLLCNWYAFIYKAEQIKG